MTQPKTEAVEEAPPKDFERLSQQVGIGGYGNDTEIWVFEPVKAPNVGEIATK